MVPPDLGSYFVEQKKLTPLSIDDWRRPDVRPKHWNSQGLSTVTHIDSLDNLSHVASIDPRQMESCQTEQGPIVIGKGPIARVGWVPTVGDVRAAPYLDTRRTAISDRYFR